jgi:predicted NBD/HSP70 family sugar kinase
MVDQALQRYAIDRIADRIADLRQRDRDFQTKYGCDYETCIERTSSDEEFVQEIEATISKTWELDLAEWEFCHKGIEDWTKRLETILLK